MSDATQIDYYCGQADYWREAYNRKSAHADELAAINARLAVENADLLSALKGLFGFDEPGAMFSERMQKARDAIANAEKRS